jgi:site-specific DNA recombinase
MFNVYNAFGHFILYRGKTMKFAIYSRKSKFTGVGESIENQVTMCREYIEKNFKVYEVFVYEDEGFSGDNVDQP